LIWDRLFLLKYRFCKKKKKIIKQIFITCLKV